MVYEHGTHWLQSSVNCKESDSACTVESPTLPRGVTRSTCGWKGVIAGVRMRLYLTYAASR